MEPVQVLAPVGAEVEEEEVQEVVVGAWRVRRAVEGGYKNFYPSLPRKP